MGGSGVGFGERDTWVSRGVVVVGGLGVKISKVFDFSGSCNSIPNRWKSFFECI